MSEIRDRLAASMGEELFSRLEHLDAMWAERKPFTANAPPAPDNKTAVDYDVILAGGGLWMLLAPLLAARGLRVLVIDRAIAGTAHREWNASRQELQSLISSGLLTSEQLTTCIVTFYRTGICRFFGGKSHFVEGVLDHAVDAGRLLELARTIAKERGVEFLDRHEVIGQNAGSTAVAVRAKCRQDDTFVDVVARFLVDARGASSPYATADLICPTVGGVLRGLNVGDGPKEIDPQVGEILITTEPIENERQHVWEAFPGKTGEVTVYLFYYARSGENVSLLDLYDRFFRTLPSYKRGEAILVRPTFGLIPGWSRLTKAPTPISPRVVLVGDAAARHSPLTYCGFGYALRNVDREAEALLTAIEDGSDAVLGSRDESIHGLTGALAYMMSSRSFHGQELNELLDVAFATLHEMGNETYANLMQDKMDPKEFAEFLRRTSSRHPKVWGKVRRGLGLGTATRWGGKLIKSLISA